VDRLSRLTNDLLTSAKVEGAAEQTQPEHIRLATALASYLDANREELGTVSVTCPSELVAVVDPAHLTRILDNYLGNASSTANLPSASKRSESATSSSSEYATRSGSAAGVRLPAIHQVRPRCYANHSGDARNRSGPVDRQSLAEANHGNASYQRNEPKGACFAVRLPADDA